MADFEHARLCKAIETARGDVQKAEYAYSRGGSCDAVNRANAALAKAHADLRRYTGGYAECGRDASGR